ncbi:prephenate dehydrogenase [Nocardioides sp. Root1257]|uniref:prephenate dehydrogenase n=1 Tax=unclassified Nocardioides TaxID=2615069 RepID=UPI0006F96C82|nr:MULTISPECIES: prephenate dehydrogenase [unclassified Nocardioides]KQW50917.1 prephenate dehydrogenase [Nocardioides sp. Root1257]KRC53713.1 prephenate dehydrogenase [Nocardioides sp. Root224]
MSELVGPVEVVGVGLLGTSVALACRRAGLDVLLTDVSADHVRTASALGAGRPRAEGDRPQLVVVAVPPDHLGAAIAAALRDTDAIVTDVGSVKTGPLAAVAGEPGVRRYVGGHPMAGSERSGPLAATADLFEGRPWAVAPHPDADPDGVALVEQLAQLCAAVVVRLSPEDHDRAVARTSHVPHLLASLVAGRLVDAPADYLKLSGQGVRDVTRIAAGSPELYGQIVAANSAAVVELLAEVRTGLDAMISALADADRARLWELLERGVDGTRAIPGKHGGPVRPTASVFVSVPDEPGVLARLFLAAGEIEVNVEDVRIDHDLGRQVGVVELIVDETRAEHLLASLESRGWVTHR